MYKAVISIQQKYRRGGNVMVSAGESPGEGSLYSNSENLHRSNSILRRVVIRRGISLVLLILVKQADG